MFKLLLVAMGAAVAAADYAVSWTPFIDSNNVNNYLDFELRLNADAQYTTTYTSADSHEEYGLALSTTVDITAYFELFSWYQHTMVFHITPLKLVPYNQAIDYVRPASNDGTTEAYLSGFREITILAVETEHNENMKTCTASLVDTISKQDTDYLLPKCAYKAKTLSKYMDKVWHYNVGEQFGTNEWYGVTPYYSMSKLF